LVGVEQNTLTSPDVRFKSSSRLNGSDESEIDFVDCFDRVRACEIVLHGYISNPQTDVSIPKDDDGDDDVLDEETNMIDPIE
jgi:hypothetical protein